MKITKKSTIITSILAVVGFMLLLGFMSPFLWLVPALIGALIGSSMTYYIMKKFKK